MVISIDITITLNVWVCYIKYYKFILELSGENYILLDFLLIVPLELGKL